MFTAGRIASSSVLHNYGWTHHLRLLRLCSCLEDQSFPTISLSDPFHLQQIVDIQHQCIKAAHTDNQLCKAKTHSHLPSSRPHSQEHHYPYPSRERSCLFISESIFYTSRRVAGWGNSLFITRSIDEQPNVSLGINVCKLYYRKTRSQLIDLWHKWSHGSLVLQVPLGFRAFSDFFFYLTGQLDFHVMAWSCKSIIPSGFKLCECGCTHSGWTNQGSNDRWGKASF